ncbi:MAG: hypothetical protein N3A63_07300 [Bacteroidetes bacterium]|nr:hypothetical protein [Bacteroidota bacterium]
MKKVFQVVAIVVMFSVIIPDIIEAKPASCISAFVRCRELCGGGWFGEGCSVGCGIGYLLCS